MSRPVGRFSHAEWLFAAERRHLRRPVVLPSADYSAPLEPEQSAVEYIVEDLRFEGARLCLPSDVSLQKLQRGCIHYIDLYFVQRFLTRTIEPAIAWHENQSMRTRALGRVFPSQRAQRIHLRPRGVATSERHSLSA